MRKRLERSLVVAWVVVVLTAAGSVIGFVLWGGPADEQPNRAQVSGTMLTAVLIVPPVMHWAWARRNRALLALSTPAQVEAAADLLAVRMRATWAQELVRRGIQTPAPVRVRWGWAADDVALGQQEVTSSPPLSTDPASLPSGAFDRFSHAHVLNSGLVTRLHDEVYARLRHGRLALIGGPGAGKTAAMILLLMEAIQYRGRMSNSERSAIPVPVWLTLGAWAPTSQGLREWVTATMARDHPYLKAIDFGPDAIGQLFDTGRIALFVDGLDELPEISRGRALERLATEAAGLRITLSCRPEQYRVALENGQHLPYTAVVQLNPVAPSAAVRYLLEGQVGAARKGWQEVTDYMQANADGVLARTLNTPLMLSLARSAYTGTDPTELLVLGLDTEDDMRGHLLDQVLVTAYPDPRARAHAAFWLGWIAQQMNTQGDGPTRDLRWWDVPKWAFRWPLQLLGALVGGTVFLLALVLLALPAWLIESESDLASGLVFVPVLLGALLAGVLVGLVVGHLGANSRLRGSRRPPGRDYRRILGKIVCGMLFGLAAGVLFRAGDDDFEVAIVLGVVGGVTFGSAVGQSGESPQSMAFRRPKREDFAIGVDKVLMGLPVGLLVGVPLGFVFWRAYGLPYGLVAFVGGLFVGLLVGLLTWLLSNVWRRPLAVAADVTPRSIYQSDFRARLLSMLLFGLLGSLVMVVSAGLLAGITVGLVVSLPTGAAYGLEYAVPMGLIVGSMMGIIGALRDGAAPLLLCTEIAFLLQKRRIRFIPLLEAAQELQVLRQAGGVYQFRHADLQDRLAKGHRLKILTAGTAGKRAKLKGRLS